MKTRFSRGEISRVRLNIEKLEVSNTKQELLNLKQEILIKKKELEYIMNYPVTDNTEVISNIPDIRTIPEFNKIKKYLVRNSPDIEIASLNVDKASAELDLIKSGSKFSVISPSLIFSKEDRDYLLGIGISIPIPVFNIKKGDIKTADSGKRIASLKKQKLKWELISKLKKYYEKYRFLGRKKEIYEKEIIPVETRNKSDTLMLYQKGEIDLLTLKRFRDNKVRARLSYLTILNDYYKVVFIIENLIGNGLDKIGYSDKKEIEGR